MPDTTPVPIVAHGFSWTAAGAWATFLALLGVIVRQVGPWRKQRDDAEDKLRGDLIKRIDKLEEQVREKDRLHDADRARHEAERALDRHRLNNVTQCLDALLLLLEQAPERATEAVARIKEMRGKQIIAEAQEKATIRAAEIVAKAPVKEGGE